MESAKSKSEVHDEYFSATFVGPVYCLMIVDNDKNVGRVSLKA
jgi:hypothetical protein